MGEEEHSRNYVTILAKSQIFEREANSHIYILFDVFEL